jgi:hypothetical protein
VIRVRAHSPRSVRRIAAPEAALLLVAAILSTAACGSGPGRMSPAHAAAATRLAEKETCPDVAWSPALDVVPTERELVGFSPTLLGVHTTWAGDGFTAETVAGGYVDDLTEAYDDLHVTRTLTLEDGVQAEVLRGRLLDNPVLAVVWRDPTVEVPCDVHALLVTGADADLEEALLRGLH